MSSSCGPVIQQLALLPDSTAVFLCLRQLSPRAWWRLRALSRSWLLVLDGSSIGDRGLIPMLVEAAGPLRTANEEVDFAGCVYTALHFGQVAALQYLLGAFAEPSWARRTFAAAVVREALVQAAVAGDAVSCKTILAGHGSEVNSADVDRALKEAQEWDAMSPGAVEPDHRAAVQFILCAEAARGEQA